MYGMGQTPAPSGGYGGGGYSGGGVSRGGGFSDGSFADYMAANGYMPSAGQQPTMNPSTQPAADGVDPNFGGDAITWYAEGDETPREGYMLLDENGEPVYYYYDENGEVQLIPDGSTVNTGKGMTKLPPLEEILDPELEEVIMENGGYTVDNIMEVYQPYLESEYARIDAAMEAEIKALREQLAARGMYNSDIAITLEQQIRAKHAGEKTSLYTEILTQAYDKAAEYSYKQEQLDLQRDQLQETQRSNIIDEQQKQRQFLQDVKEFEAETGIKWAGLDLDTRKQLFNEWDSQRSYDLDVFKANTSASRSSGSSAKPASGSTLVEIKNEIIGMISQGASMEQVAGEIKSYVDLGYITSAQANTLVQTIDREIGLGM
jgi:hypothetical protein